MKYELTTTIKFVVDCDKHPDFLLQYKALGHIPTALMTTVSWLADCIDWEHYPVENWRVKQIK